MDIKAVGVSKVVNLYRDNNKMNKSSKIEKKGDTLEISPLAKKLSGLSIDDINIDKTKEIERIKEEIKKGSYNIDSKDLARKIINSMKGSGI
ncbi:flagellar biosynthesis anti-sigma factor FlgM [Clostridium sp.]|uniref:flagellar biosynthesis anti-sigma factor FlgM n=1 Tax=Clostridium sp. TaxID=1506 RepID=UPI003463B632